MPMLRCPFNYLVVLIAAIVGLSSAQRTITTSVNGSPTTVYIPYLIEPTGVQDVRGSFGDSIPLQCTTTCYAQETIYGCVLYILVIATKQSIAICYKGSVGAVTADPSGAAS